MARNSSRLSAGSTGGNSGMCTSRRPWRLRSTSTMSGRLVAKIQKIWPRLAVSAISLASIPYTRPESPASPSPPPRRPVAWSASSTNTITCPKACRMVKIFSRFPSVAPTHFSRKFFSSTMGMPHSPAKHSTSHVLPVPMRPVMR